MSIRGLQQAQAANLKLIAAVKPQGGLGRAARYAAVEAERYAISITHVDTGTLRASHRIDQDGPARFIIHPDPAAKNWRSGSRAAVYGEVENARGGEHAFYERTVSERGSDIGARAVRYLISELP
jgi:hypothetical protein